MTMLRRKVGTVFKSISHLLYFFSRIPDARSRRIDNLRNVPFNSFIFIEHITSRSNNSFEHLYIAFTRLLKALYEISEISKQYFLRTLKPKKAKQQNNNFQFKQPGQVCLEAIIDCNLYSEAVVSRWYQILCVFGVKEVVESVDRGGTFFFGGKSSL